MSRSADMTDGRIYNVLFLCTVTAQVAAIPGEATLGRNDVKVGRPGDGPDEDFG